MTFIIYHSQWGCEQLGNPIQLITDHKYSVAELSYSLWVLGPAQQHMRSCWQPHLAGARGILISRSRSDTLGEAKALCCLEIPKISDRRGRRRPVKGSIQGVWEKVNIPWTGRHYYICQEDLLGADATYSSFPWAGGHHVTGATKPHRHTVCLPQSCQVC